MNRYALAAAWLAIAGMSASCQLQIRGGSEDASTPAPTPAPTATPTPTPTPLPSIYSIDYGTAPFIHLRTLATSTITPTVTGGTPTSYAILPALPTGMSLDPSTGAISGTPGVAATPADYTVTATSAVGQGSATIRLTVKNLGALNAKGIVGIGTTGNAWKSTDEQTAAGSSDGAFKDPQDVAIDAANGFFYVADRGNGRITKHSIATGALLGWIGREATTPTGGDAGCTTGTTFTPGWCTGGSTQASYANQPTFNSVGGIRIDVANDRLYVVADNYVGKYVLSTGQPLGWIGRISVVPTGGAAGCTAAVNGAVTPGWCTGGAASGGTGDGMFSNARDLAVNATGDALYVADMSNYRIMKFTLSTGVFVGWIGKVGTAPTGGDAGCTTAAVGSTTPGWCTGGAAAYGTDAISSQFASLDKIQLNAARTALYVGDNNFATVRKISVSTGQVLGWMGKIGTSPTGGDAGCAGASAGSFTPGWCTGGSPSGAAAVDNYSWAGSLAVDETNSKLYTFSSYVGALQRAGFPGGFEGWMGRIVAAPTGGGAGCSGAAVNTSTPGWCTGGGGANGIRNGQYGRSAQAGLRLDSANSKLYVADTANHRIVRMNLAGTSTEWIGMTVAGSNAWTTVAGVSAGVIDGTFTGIKATAVDTANNALYVSGGNRVQKFNLATGAFVGWIGLIEEYATGGAAGCTVTAIGSPTPGWCTGGSASSIGTSLANGGFTGTPAGLAIDSANDLLYVTDSWRINKYRASTGAYLGYYGRIATSPTGGDPGCSGATGTTPGWCTGGSSTSYTGDGGFSGAHSLFLDPANGHIYVGDRGAYRVAKITVAGAWIGWVGQASSVPTGGAPGCTGISIGASTPGWCTGGTATNGAGDAGFYYPGQVTVDTERMMLYVSDYYGHRIMKFNASTGAPLGWIGKIGVSPTGGDPGCAGAAVGTTTPGWCRGGSANLGSLERQFYYPVGVHADAASGTLHVTDVSGRVQILNSVSTASVGWIGYVNIAPTGGFTGCTAATGSLTPGLCIGGGTTTHPYSTMGYASYPEQLQYDAANGQLYLIDTAYNRIQRFDNL